MYGEANHGAPTWQGLAPPASTFQQRPNPTLTPHPLPHGNLPGPPFYRYSPPAPFPPIRTPNAGDPYPHSHPRSLPQLPSHFRPQNVNHNPAVAPPLYPEMVWPPQPRGVLLPPPPRLQGQMPLRSAFYSPPPPTMSGFFTPSASPPPPPPVSSFSVSKGSELGSGDEIIDTNQATDTTRHPEVGTRQGDVSLINGSEATNRSPPPLKAMEPQIVEVLDDLWALTADSDMEMEDDITPAAKDPDMSPSHEGLLNNKDIRIQDPTNAPQILPEHYLVDHIPSEFLNLEEKPENSSTSKLSLEVPSQAVHAVHTTECPLDSHVGSIVSPTPSRMNSGLIKGGTPMGLIQEYASDDNSENDCGLSHTDMKPLRVIPLLVAVDSTSLEKDKGSKNSTRTSKNTVKGSGEKKVESEPASLKVDEFGRFVREASSESDPNSGYGNGREQRKRRGRSRSYSRSPRDRRRSRRSSPRRKDKRSRSHSTSPRKQRSRSRSPPSSRRGSDFSSGKFRSSRGRSSDCFDFLRGRCYRGASCRYVHHIVDKTDSSTSRSQRSNRRHEEIRSSTKSHKTKQVTKHSPVKLPEPVYDDNDCKADGKRDDTVMNSHKTIVLDIKAVLAKSTAPNSHEPPSINVLNSTGDTSQIAEDQNANIPSHHMADSKSEFVPNNLIPTAPLPNVSSNESHPSFPAPPGLTISHESSLPPRHITQLPIAYSSMPHGSSYPPQFGHGWSPQFPNQHPQFSVPPNSSWNLLPPPPPRPPYDLQSTHGVSSQIQPNYFPPRNESGSQISALSHPIETLSGSQTYRTILSVQEPPSDSGNPISQSGALGLLREERLSHTDQELSTSTSLGQANLHHQQYVTSSQDLPSSRVMPFSTESSSGIQQASSHLQYPLGDSGFGVPRTTGFMSQRGVDHENKNQFSSASDFGLPRIVAKHNPYASTFEKPLVSKFGSRFDQDKGPLFGNQYENHSRLATDNELGVDSYGSRPIESSPRAYGEQYDPLFDSIEPTSNANKKECRITDSDRMEIRSDSHNKLLDLGETSGHEVTAVASTTSLDNDGFGETADAEVGALENGSPSDPAGVEREPELKSPRKKKKSKKKKDSRSTKPFKMAIADFVKDVLKPSWRQGNLSKEAFKTIVKKTVDKVSGAMKGHNVPKSRLKIDQYIDSSRRKLTKLVMGYVDKYVKP